MGLKDIKVEGNNLPIREFNLNWMCKNSSIVMIAKRGSGKSWVCRSILKHLHRIGIPGGVIIAPTDKMTNFYGKFFPELYIHYEYKNEILENVFYRQKEIINKQKKKMKKRRKVDPRSFVVMDDCLGSKTTWQKEKPILEMFFNGRHFKITFILTMQFPLGIPPELRSNFDYVFLLADDFISNQKRLYDHYAGIFPSFDSFKSVFLELTNDFGSMVIVNRGSRTDFLDKIFWFKAKRETDEKIGCRQFIKLHDKNFDRDWDKKKKIFNIDDMVTRKKNTKIFQIDKIGSR